MAFDVEIKCINKTNRNDPHDRIQNVGGINPDGKRWKLTVAEAISGIESGKWTFYTFGGGRRVKVIIANNNGHKYLKTEADGIHPNNLLALPECS